MEVKNAAHIAEALREQLERRGIGCRGVYSADQMPSFNELEAWEDVDVRVIVSNDTVGGREDIRLRHVSSGVILCIDGCPEVLRAALTDACGGTVLVDVCYISDSSLQDVEDLLSSHCANAASTNLYRGQVLVGDQWLRDLSAQIRDRFPSKEYVQRRIRWVCKQGIQCLEKHWSRGNENRKDLWLTALRPVLLSSRVIVTKAMLSPTARSCIPRVKEACQRVGDGAMMEFMRDVLCLGDVSRSTCRELLGVVSISYSQYSSLLNDINFHPLKQSYWLDWITHQVDGGDLEAAVFAIGYISLRMLSLCMRQRMSISSTLQRAAEDWTEATGVAKKRKEIQSFCTNTFRNAADVG